MCFLCNSASQCVFNPQEVWRLSGDSFRLAAGRCVAHVSTPLSTCMNKAPHTHTAAAAACSDSESNKPSYNLADIFLVNIFRVSLLCITHSMQHQIPTDLCIFVFFLFFLIPCSSSSVCQSKCTTTQINTRWAKWSNLIFGLKRQFVFVQHLFQFTHTHTLLSHSRTLSQLKVDVSRQHGADFSSQMSRLFVSPLIGAEFTGTARLVSTSRCRTAPRLVCLDITPRLCCAVSGWWWSPPVTAAVAVA